MSPVRAAQLRRCLGVAAISLAALALAACGSSKGIQHKPEPLTEISHPQVQPQRLWSASVGDGSDGLFTGLRIAVRPDAVFVGSTDGVAKALDPKTGKMIWETDTDARLSAGPTVNGDQVLFGTFGARVIALDRATGKLKWTGKASSEVLAAPVSDGSTVVVRSIDGRVYGLSVHGGHRLWSYDRPAPRLTVRGQSMPLVMGAEVLIGQDNGTVAALDTQTGKPQWQQAIAIPTGRSELSRLVDIDAQLLPSLNGVYVDSYGGTLALIDPATGHLRWKRQIKSWTGMALSGGGDLLYVSAADSHVWALDPESGAKAWEQKALQYRSVSAPAIQNGKVVVGDYKGYLHWLSPDDGTIIARTQLDGDAIVTAPVVANDILYAMDVDGHLAAYTAKKVSSDD